MTDDPRAQVIDRAKRLLEDITPGGWTYFTGSLRPEFPARIQAVIDRDGAEIVRWGGFDGCDQPKKQVIANAKFIAAAPELVRDLLNLLAVVPPPPQEPDQRTHIHRSADEVARCSVCSLDPPSPAPRQTADETAACHHCGTHHAPDGWYLFCGQCCVPTPQEDR